MKQAPAVQIRDRIVELRRVPASELRANPRNWRKHPDDQRAAMRGILEEVGYAGALLARETPEGLELIDGHLRAETTPNEVVPVLVLDVSEAEADKILATYDPIAAMAKTDAQKFDEVIRGFDTGSAALSEMLDDVAQKSGLVPPDEPKRPEKTGTYCVLVTCEDEAQQLELIETMMAEGLKCRGLIS